MSNTPITPDDVESSLRRAQDDIEARANEAKSTLIPAGIALGVLALLIAYLIGKRVGNKRSAIVEIRRI